MPQKQKTPHPDGRSGAAAESERLAGTSRYPDTAPEPEKQQRALARASVDDSRWFKAHPGRAYRARPFVPGELGDVQPPGAGRAFVVVHQVAPGIRLKVPGQLLAGHPPDNDLDLAELFLMLRRVAGPFMLSGSATEGSA